MTETLDIAMVVQSYRMLTSKDKFVAQVAKHALTAVVKRKTRHLPSENEICNYINGASDGDLANPSGDIRSLWSRTRSATVTLKKSINLSWSFNTTRKQFEISIPMPQQQPEVTIVHPVARHHLLGVLRKAARVNIMARLQRKPNQGKVFEVSALWSSSNHFLRSGLYTRFADWQFTHRARLDCVPLNTTKRFGDGDKRCRRCGYTLETLPHVINHCLPHMTAITNRHNAILDRLVVATHKDLGTAVVNRTTQEIEVGDQSSKKPDLVITNHVTKKVIIIDVTCPFENRLAAFQTARNLKQTKYGSLTSEMEAEGYSVKLDAFIVGSLGSWDPANEKVLRTLRISRKYSKMMRKLMTSDAIKWSRDIYVEHVSGVR